MNLKKISLIVGIILTIVIIFEKVGCFRRSEEKVLVDHPVSSNQQQSGMTFGDVTSNQITNSFNSGINNSSVSSNEQKGGVTANVVHIETQVNSVDTESQRKADEEFKRLQAEKEVQEWSELLAQDAKKAHFAVWAIDRALQRYPSMMMGDPAPPRFELQYWNLLKQNQSFVKLGASEPFNYIFAKFFQLEKINELIDSSDKGSNKKIAWRFYKDLIENKSHTKLLSYFLSDEDIKKLEIEYGKSN